MKMRSRSNWLLLLALSLGCAKKPAPAPAPPSAEPAPAQPEATSSSPRDRYAGRFETLTERLEEGLEKYHVPGMSIAIVSEDSVVYAEGFGFSDLESKEKVTPRTRFAIGSSTKAFTATLIGQLVDEGKMSWDDPIAQHVPEFLLPVQSDDAEAQATIRDALCHRTGFTRMGVLWASGEVPRKEFLAQAAKAEPLAPFREKFLYNNVTYTAAGEASARVEDVLWAELVTRNLLVPLGMRNSVVLAAEAKELGMAQGYKWNEDASRFEPLPMRSLDEIAPAGAINSTALDMSAWVSFQINRGRYRGERLIEADTLEQTWQPQMDVGGGAKYGMGWFVEDYEGQPMLHHGGNIDGYSAMVSFLPEERLGFVMLSNTSFSGMQSAVRGIVYDTLLEEQKPAGADEDVSTFEGEYLADFGPFSGKSFTVSSEDGVLFVDVPGQQNYELAAPDEDGKRSFALTKTIAVRFVEEDGKVNTMHLYQGGFDFELFRKGYTPPPEMPLTALEPMLGEYEHAKLGRAEVLIRNNRLAIDVPQQMVYELHPPDDAGMWRFRVKDDISIEFSPSKKPEKVVLHQGGKTFDLVRTKSRAKSKSSSGPSPARLEKLRASKKAERSVEALNLVQMTADVQFVQAGISGTITAWVGPDGRSRSQLNLGKFGWSDTMVSPDGGWEVSAFSPRDELMGKRLQQALVLSPLFYARSFAAVFDDVSVEGTSSIDGREVIEVSLTKGDLPNVKAKVDAETGDVLETSYGALWSGPGTMPTKEVAKDYRERMGLRLPHHIERTTEASGTLRVTNIQYVSVSGGDDLFPSEPPPRKK